MLVTPELSLAVSQLLPKLQRQLAQETRSIIESIDDLKLAPGTEENLIKDEELTIMLKHVVKTWRRENGSNKKGV